MRMKLQWITALLLVLSALPGVSVGQQVNPPVEKRELIYCADRMTHEEREAYRGRMRAARTVDEKETLRAAHRTEMQARAASKGDAGRCEAVGRQHHGGGPAR
jgi:hypothetical protein